MNFPEHLSAKKLLLLDMNGTFMFGHDRFSKDENYWAYYKSLGGELSSLRINRIIRNVYKDLLLKYADERYRLLFPSVHEAVVDYVGNSLNMAEIEKVVNTFAYYERGTVSLEYARALQQLAQRFQLAGVFDIWAPKQAWLQELERAKVRQLFATFSFSSDHGMVKPSPKPFRQILRQLEVDTEQALVVGDSVQRDLAAATNAGLDCVLVGREHHGNALAHFDSLLEFTRLATAHELEDFAV